MEIDTIVVESVDNSFLRIDTDPSISHELSDFFSFLTPNYRFMPLYKNGRWDGKTRLYKIMGSILPAGLYGILLTFASDRDYKVVDRRTPSNVEKPSERELEAFLASLRPHSDGKAISFYDYQEESVKIALDEERSTIVSSTSSGKSLIIYSIIRWYERIVPGKILIIVPTVNLASQMYSDFDDYASETTWNSEDHVHKIYSGQKINADVKTYVSTYQSLQHRDAEYLKQFDVIICDEVHGAESKTIVNIMEKSVNASIRIGFTGTLRETKLHKLSIIGLFGDIKKVTNSRDLMDRGIITPITIKFLMLKYNQNICKEINRKVVEKITPTGKKIYRKNYFTEMDFITECEQRNMFIANLVEHLPGNGLILFTKVRKHGKPLFKLLKKRLDKKKKVYYISGETKVDEREKIRRTIERETDSVLTASYGTLSTGVNIKNLNYVIFASPYKTEIKVLQSIGRLLRLKEGKNMAYLFDIVDDFRYKKSVNYSFKHFVKRFDIYKKERFPVTISEYNLI